MSVERPEYDDLYERCERYKKALNDLKPFLKNSAMGEWIIEQALSEVKDGNN